MIHEFKLKSEYIELIKLLKLLGIAETGGHAKIMVEEGKIFVNGMQETRKRAKLRAGDEVEVMDQKILVK
ncbi:MAG: RNA-binding S4 domain-containing protein [Prolixibacteraceae bacterium]